MATQVLRQAGPTVPAVDQAAWRLPHGGAAGAAGAVAVPTLRDVQSGGGPPPGTEPPVGVPMAASLGRGWVQPDRACPARSAAGVLVGRPSDGDCGGV